jgi:Putative peptidase (DUF1758)
MVLRTGYEPVTYGSTVHFHNGKSCANAKTNETQGKHRNIYGVGNIKAATIKHTVNIQIHPRFESNKIHCMEAKVTSSLTGAQPETRLTNPREKLKNYTLTDPDFYKPGQIDLIIGVDHFPDILLKGVEKISTCVLQETTLGWITSGRMQVANGEYTTKTNILISQVQVKELNEQLKQFWDTEEIRKKPPTSEAVEQKYTDEVKRGSDGRYTAKLPMNQIVS